MWFPSLSGPMNSCHTEHMRGTMENLIKDLCLQPDTKIRDKDSYQNILSQYYIEFLWLWQVIFLKLLRLARSDLDTSVDILQTELTVYRTKR